MRAHESAAILSKITLIYCLTLRNVGHFGFYYTFSRVLSDLTTMAGVRENPKIDTKIMKLTLLCRTLYQFNV